MSPGVATMNIAADIAIPWPYGVPQPNEIRNCRGSTGWKWTSVVPLAASPGRRDA